MPQRKETLPQCDAYIFDIDGTLLVIRDLVHWNALRQAMLEVYGVDTSIEGISYHGKTDLSILRAATARVGVPADQFEAGLRRATEVVCREVSEHAANISVSVCDSIPDLLDRLESGGKLLGIASGNLEAVGWLKIEAARLRKFFDFGCFGDRYENRPEIFSQALSEVRKRLGGNAQACFVGDTPADIAAARCAGARVIAVATGTYSFPELCQYAPDLCLTSCGDL